MPKFWRRRGGVWFADYFALLRAGKIVEDHKTYIVVRVGNKLVRFVPVGWCKVDYYESEDGKYVILVSDNPADCLE